MRWKSSLVTVGILFQSAFSLEIDPALPMVVLAESGHYLKALVHYESLVALEGSGILQLVHKMREHEDCKVSQCPLVGYPLVLIYSGGIGIIMGIALCSEMELTGSPVFRPA